MVVRVGVRVRVRVRVGTYEASVMKRAEMAKDSMNHDR